MPKTRVHLKNFESFAGLDEKSSDLTRSRDAAKTIDNFELNRVFSLGGRKGFKKVAAKTQTWFLGLHNYVYQDENGATQEELLGIDNNLWRLKETGNFNIVYAGAGTTYGYSILPHSSEGYFEFKLFVNAAVVATVNLKGSVDTAPYTVTALSALETAIEAVSGFTVTITGGASSLDAAILPLSTQTTTPKITATDIPFAYWEMVQPAGVVSNPFQSFYDARANADFKNATFQNLRNCCYIATGYNKTMKYDGQSVYSIGLRKMGDKTAASPYPADIIASAGSATGLTGTYQIFTTFAYRDNRGNFIRSRPSGITSITLANTKLNVQVRSYQNTALFGTKTAVLSSNTIVLDTFTNDNLSHLGYPNVAVGDYATAMSTSGSNYVVPQVVGDFSQLVRKITSVNVDARTIIVDGATPAGAVATSYFYVSDAFANWRCFTPTSTQTNKAAGTTITGGVNCKVGDILYFPTSKIEATVTEVTSSTIKVDKQVSVTILETCSVIRVEFWRTKNGAFETFYKFAELGNNFQIAPYTLLTNNNVGDDDLGELWIDTGKFADDPFWKPSIVTEHQGVLILSGDFDYPNRAFYEDILTPEGFQHSTNYLDIPSSESGAITACWSDDFNQLAIFKAHSYFNITGEFTAELPAFSINKVTENDYGIASQNSLVKFRGINIGIGELGFIAFKNGEIDYKLGEKLSPVFLNKTAANNSLAQSEILRVTRSIIVNDHLNERIICFIPAELYSASTTKVPYIYSKIFVYDYSDNVWFNYTFPTPPSDRDGSYLPSAGMALHNGQIYFADKDFEDGATYEQTSTLYKFHSNSTDDIAYDYADNTKAINYDLWLQWESLDDPGIEKIFDRFKLYVFDPYTFVPFTARVRTYFDYDTTTAIDDFQLSVTSETTHQFLYKLKATKCKNMSIRITVATLNTKPTITGIETTAAVFYSQEKLA